MEFLADTVIAKIEHDMEDTPMRQQIVDELINFSNEGNDDKETLVNYFDDLVANSDDFSDEDKNQVDEARAILFSVNGDLN